MKTNTKQAINGFYVCRLTPLLFYGIFPAWRLFLTSYTVSCSQPFTSSHCLIEFLFISDLSLTLFSFCFCLKHQPSEERENFSFVCLFPFFFFVVGTRQKAIEWLLWDLECFYDEGFWGKPRQKRWRSCSWNGIVKVGVLIRGGFLSSSSIKLIHSLTLLRSSIVKLLFLCVFSLLFWPSKQFFTFWYLYGMSATMNLKIKLIVVPLKGENRGKWIMLKWKDVF